VTKIRFNTIQNVVACRLCMGCGACVSACPNGAITLVDIEDVGLQPKTDSQKCEECGECIKVCPGIHISLSPLNSRSIPQLRKAWGPVLEVWEGYASDPEIRFNGSSGGVATALALFCLEKENFAGVLHTGAKLEDPLRNMPTFSKNRAELLTKTGSRYSPAAPCEKLNWIEESNYPCVFIGKPCDVVALHKSQAVNSSLDNKIGLAISIFCAGTPTTTGTLKLLNILSVKPEDVVEIRYRGYGWPGMTTVKIKGYGQIRQMTYEQAWGDILSKYSQFRCRVCPDSTGEFADISCGDPWYRKIEPDDPGRSLVLVRTERGKEVLRKAMKESYIQLHKVEPNTLPRSQKALLNRRRHLWGRLLAMWVMRVPIPHFEGFSMYSNWQELSFLDKICSVLGTFRRIISRKWYKPIKHYSESQY
jgi:coenzyme F420 hydrogenase subunit beta